MKYELIATVVFLFFIQSSFIPFAIRVPSSSSLTNLKLCHDDVSAGMALPKMEVAGVQRPATANQSYLFQIMVVRSSRNARTSFSQNHSEYAS
jgi:hypothetical protein